MRLYEEILKELLNESFVSTNEIVDAIDNHKVVDIHYHAEGGNEATGLRRVLVVAYGRMRNGDAIRAFEFHGAHYKNKSVGYRTFLVSRITKWKETGTVYATPPGDKYGEFNRDGDRSFIDVYKVAKFDGDTAGGYGPTRDITYATGPKRKDGVRRQVAVGKDGGESDGTADGKSTAVLRQGDGRSAQSAGPKTKKDINTAIVRGGSATAGGTGSGKNGRMMAGLDRLAKALEKRRKDNDGRIAELERMRAKLGDTGQPVKVGELKRRLSAKGGSDSEIDRIIDGLEAGKE